MNEPTKIKDLILSGVNNRKLDYEAKQFIIGVTRSIERFFTSDLKVEQILKLVLRHFGIQSKVKQCNMVINAPIYNRKYESSVEIEDALYIETEFSEWIIISIAESLRNKSTILANYIEPPCIWCSKNCSLLQEVILEFKSPKSFVEEFSINDLIKEDEKKISEIIVSCLTDLTTANISHPYILAKDKYEQSDFDNSLWLRTLSKKRVQHIGKLNVTAV